MKDQAALSAAWLSLAKRTAWKVSLAWWLERLKPWVIAGSVAAFAGILLLRRGGADVSFETVWPWMAGTLGLTGLMVYFLARPKFILPEQALVRLEARLKLYNALSVALAGHGAWPELPPMAEDGWRWRWSQISLPWLTVAGCMALALWLPLTPEANATLPTMEPQAWEQMEEWLEKLEEEKLITEEEKEQQAAKIAELRDQPPETWFSHDSLHASDTLKEQMQRDMAKMAQNLKTMERSLNALQNYSDQFSQVAKEQLLKDLDEALKGLQASGLELNPELLKELAQMDPKNLQSLSKEQLDQMREALKKGAGACQGMCQNPGFLGDGEGEDDALAMMLGEMERQGQPGQGDITRGPGTAPLTLSKEENDFGTSKYEGVTNSDLSKAQLGTMLELQDGKHEVDRTYQGAGMAGDAAHQGTGGEQVWRETLTPEEKAVLKRVFK
ncbi:hypothetical protein WJU23_12515 [Prosthecobacter sp. SYSU 5D2]|uniref:hypothetical protein n=1 Tax=Prosthecobacter sp. SYSU 5D2 TaxID=3134134 RepID=UPI0031FEE251